MAYYHFKDTFYDAVILSTDTQLDELNEMGIYYHGQGYDVDRLFIDTIIRANNRNEAMSKLYARLNDNLVKLNSEIDSDKFTIVTNIIE